MLDSQLEKANSGTGGFSDVRLTQLTGKAG
jgi:hypothetical protein